MPSARLCFAAVVVAASLAACGSSSTPSSTSTTTPSSSTSGPATVKVVNVSGYGDALANASGQPLYTLSADTTNKSTCTSSCLATWPALTVSGKPVAGSGVTGSELSEFKRSDGTEQVSYYGHPLYTFKAGVVEDAAAEDGGIWYLIAADGSAIKHSKKHKGY